eukprot:CAMPEP_0172595890 /NCGR_PEP_ID=MMETSP1068-20121228/15563_1 /TAXON_ID=35684 /ORGANISM="Pseudopedinella elastica, Strain CCMP716" /LENGTH=208 /DNA_ID=CAMNT_0013394645 /DNA_START=93 /DNA_END=716 /DNA_ORIENTATION=+
MTDKTVKVLETKALNHLRRAFRAGSDAGETLRGVAGFLPPSPPSLPEGKPELDRAALPVLLGPMLPPGLQELPPGWAALPPGWSELPPGWAALPPPPQAGFRQKGGRTGGALIPWKEGPGSSLRFLAPERPSLPPPPTPLPTPQNPADVGRRSKFVGVLWGKRQRKWRAVITEGGKRNHLGYFDSEEDAARAYDARAAPLGRRRLNFP